MLVISTKSNRWASAFRGLLSLALAAYISQAKADDEYMQMPESSDGTEILDLARESSTTSPAGSNGFAGTGTMTKELLTESQEGYTPTTEELAR